MASLDAGAMADTAALNKKLHLFWWGMGDKGTTESAIHASFEVARPALDKAGERRISQKRVTSILEDTFSRASEFKRQHKLGVYKKARLGNTFRWELEEMGYSKKFIELATEGLIVYVTRE